MSGKLLIERVGAGTWVSQDYVERGEHNALLVELMPEGDPSDASLQMLDSDDTASGFKHTVDMAGTQSGLTSATANKYLVASVHRYIKVQLTVTAGTWSVRVTPINATNQITTTIAGSVNLSQYGNTPVGSANPIDTQAGDGKIASIGALADVEATGNGSVIALLKRLRTLLSGVLAVAIDQTTPGTTNLTESRPYARRNAGVLHRNAITAADKLATPGVITASGQTDTGGTLASATTYYYAIAAYNRWGTTVTTTPASAAPGGTNNALRLAFAQVAGADGYDIFLSVDANPKWVARITEAQRAAGGVIIAVGGSPQAGGAAGSMDIGVAGTGVANNVNPFTMNNAYTPANVTAINCAGRSRAHVLVKLAVTDLRSLPTLSIVPFFANQLSGTDWHQGTLKTVQLLTAAGECLEQDFEIDVDGSTGLVILVETINGQGAACSIWVEIA